MSNIQDTNIIPELQSPFEQLREVDADGKEWWNSRKLARVIPNRSLGFLFAVRHREILMTDLG